jgi:hypothetical protein
MRENGDRENGDKKSFWATLPGILTQIIGLITALTVLYVTLHNGVPPSPPTPSPTPTTEFLTEPIAVLTPTPTPTSPPYVAPSPLSVTVQGTVTDENNMPVGGLKVSIDDLSDITGDDGIYIIRDVPVGVGIIWVERMNEVVYRSACEIERSDEIKVVDISIPAEEPTTGEIRLFSDSTSAVGADAYIDGEYQGRMFQSGSNALFQITDIPPETYQIKVTKSGYQDFIGSVTVIAGQRTEIGFYLEPSSLTQLSISPDPPSFDLGSMSAGETASRIFSISNAGGGTLEWSVSDDQPWITVNPTIGTDSGTVTLNINTAGLSPGSYSGITTISSNGGTETISISLKILVFDFFAEAPNAKWDNGEEFIPWEGERSDPRGTVKNASNWLLEDDSRKEKVLFTHPKWEDNGFILGRYFLSEPIQPGDRFKAQVGFQSGSRGEVTFSVAYIESLEPVRLISLASVRDTGNDGQLRHIDVGLTDIAGEQEIILWVGAGSSSYQDWAVWAYPRIER